MARRDLIHNAVKEALITDGWQIVADPYRIVYKDATLEADMKADKLLVVERDKRSIIIEVKSFLEQSFIHAFLAACGQYQAYKYLLEEKGQMEEIYMAISQEVYYREFHRESVQVLINRFEIHLIVVDTENEVISEWIESNNTAKL